MQLTINETLSIYHSLTNLKNENSLSVFMAWAIDDILKELQTHVERAQKEQNKLLKQYGTLKDEDTQQYEISPENKGNYIKSINDLTAYKVDVNIKKIAFNDLQKENIKVSKNIDISILRLIIDND